MLILKCFNGWILCCLCFSVESYMQMFGGAAAPSFQDLARQSMHALAHFKSQWMQHQLELHPMLSITPNWAEPMVAFPYSTGSSRMPALSMISDSSSSERASDVFSVQSMSSADNGGRVTPPFPPALPAKQSQVRIQYSRKRCCVQCVAVPHLLMLIAS